MQFHVLGSFHQRFGIAIASARMSQNPMEAQFAASRFVALKRGTLGYLTTRDRNKFRICVVFFVPTYYSFLLGKVYFSLQKTLTVSVLSNMFLQVIQLIPSQGHNLDGKEGSYRNEQ